MATTHAFLRLETPEDYDLEPLIQNVFWKQIPHHWRLESIEHHPDVVLFKLTGSTSDLPSVLGLLKYSQRESGCEGLVYSA